MNRRALKALGDPTRLRIVEYLSRACCRMAALDDQGSLCGVTVGDVCCQITGAEKISSTVSQHLHELEACGLVLIERRGKNMLCTLQTAKLKELAGYLAELSKENLTGQCC